MNVGNFGQELRMERLNRGVALEKITEVTKISQRHLIALEENQFRVLPGGILNKGIVRGYVNVLGLDEMDWISRFQRAYAERVIDEMHRRIGEQDHSRPETELSGKAARHRVQRDVPAVGVPTIS